MGLFEFLMLFCFGFSWPFSILRSIRSRSTKGKSLMFVLLVFFGYVFGIVHKVLYSFNWVIWAYVVLLCLVGFDLSLYFINRRREKAEGLEYAARMEVNALGGSNEANEEETA